MACTTCDRMGHQASNCFRNKYGTESRRNESQAEDCAGERLSELEAFEQPIDKYIFEIGIEGYIVPCHVDLGSQYSLIRAGLAGTLGLNVKY